MSRAGQDVTLIARGPHLEAMQKNGVKLLIGGEEIVAHPRCIEDPAEAGPQDYVIITLKAHSLPGIAADIQPLLGEGTAVVTGVNGIPWWYFYKLGGPYENHQLESVDPGGKFWDAVGPERAIGFVVYPAAEIAEPGVIRHIEGDRYTTGSRTGNLPNVPTSFARRSKKLDSNPVCAAIFAMTSGSSYGEIFALTPSAHSPMPPWIRSQAKRAPAASAG